MRQPAIGELKTIGGICGELDGTRIDVPLDEYGFPLRERISISACDSYTLVLFRCTGRRDDGVFVYEPYQSITDSRWEE